MAEQGLRCLVPGLMQLPVCLALIYGAGFNFGDLKSTVMFLCVFHYIMMAIEAFFQFVFQQDCDEDVWWPIVIINAVTQVVLQILGFSAVSVFVWQHKNNSCKKTPTVIAAIIIVIIELVWVVIMVVKICKRFKLGTRMSKCLWGKRPTNSRTPRDNNGPNEDQDGLLTSTNHIYANKENDVGS